MVKTVEDCLLRRTHALLINAEATVEIAPKVAKIFAT